MNVKSEVSLVLGAVLAWSFGGAIARFILISDIWVVAIRCQLKRRYDRPVMMREIRDQVKSEAIPLGIDVVDVRIRRTDLMPDVLQETYDRMSAERLAEAALLRAVGESQSIKVRAESYREYVELVATARRESERF
jgi:hypothetical protein